MAMIKAFAFELLFTPWRRDTSSASLLLARLLPLPGVWLTGAVISQIELLDGQ